MSGHLERRAPGAGGITRGGTQSVEAGQATALSQLDFSGTALEYATDIPRKFRTGVKAATEVALRSGAETRSGGELILASSARSPIVAPKTEAVTERVEKAAIASGVRQLAKPRKSNGRVVQRRVGWQATPDRIVITTAERELRKTGAGKLAPAGEWLIEDRRTYVETGGRATKRTGTVPQDTNPVPNGTDSGSGATSVEASVAERFPEGAQALGTLPSAVRSSAIARVPAPRQFDGVIFQYSNASTGKPESLEVNVLRMDTERAVVIQATRPIKGTSWSVSQASYKLSAPEIEQA